MTECYHQYTNAIYAELGIGSFQGYCDWNFDPAAEYGIQEAAYGLMGNSWENPAEYKAYICAHAATATYSEPLAEAIYAVGL